MKENWPDVEPELSRFHFKDKINDKNKKNNKAEPVCVTETLNLPHVPQSPAITDIKTCLMLTPFTNSTSLPLLLVSAASCCSCTLRLSPHPV